jgi:hypothetical protein
MSHSSCHLLGVDSPLRDLIQVRDNPRKAPE